MNSNHLICLPPQYIPFTFESVLVLGVNYFDYIGGEEISLFYELRSFCKVDH